RPRSVPLGRIDTVAGPPSAFSAGPSLLASVSPMVTVAPVPEVTSMPTSAPLTGAPARVVTLTVQPLEAAIPVPAAEAIGPRAVTFTAAQPVAWALMPLLPGPETVIGPTRMVWSPRPVVTSIPFEPGPAVSIAPTPIVTGPSSPITIIPGESEPPVFTV